MSEYAVTNPATGERVKEYPTISDAALADAIATADRAHREWSRATTIEERAALVRRVGELHTERREELAEIIVREMGKPVEQALGEVDFCAAIYEYYADNATTLLADEPITLSDGDGLGVRAPQLRRRAARDHAVELPVLPGRAVRRPESRRRQHDPAEARAAVPGVGGGDPGGSSTTRASPRARTRTSTPRTTRSRTSSPTPGCRACRSPARSVRARPWPRSPDGT